MEEGRLRVERTFSVLDPIAMRSLLTVQCSVQSVNRFIINNTNSQQENNLYSVVNIPLIG